MPGRTLWLIDGNNVMGARPDGWWRDRAAAALRLARAVDSWQQRTGHDVVLVFDGPDRPEVLALSRQGFEVRFARRSGRDAADDVIAQLAASAEGPVTVVTSDAGLIRRLPPGAAVAGAGAFLRMLDDSPGVDGMLARGAGRRRREGGQRS